MTLQDYLQSKYTPKSSKSYYRDISLYQAAQPQAATASYSQIIAYLEQLRKSQTPSSMKRILQSIKKYYNYLAFTEQRRDNPAASIQLKDAQRAVGILPNNLLSSAEIKQLWQHLVDKQWRYKLLKNRNLSMLSLVLYQGLTSREIQQMQPSNIQLPSGKVYVAGSSRTHARTLALQPCQILPLYDYLQKDRAALLQGKTSKSLFINKLGRAETGESLHYLLESNSYVIPDKKVNPKQVRMSVLAEQFRQGKSLEQVQYFAGHKYPSSTERYNFNHLQALKEEILAHHPLK